MGLWSCPLRLAPVDDRAMRTTARAWTRRPGAVSKTGVSAESLLSSVT